MKTLNFSKRVVAVLGIIAFVILTGFSVANAQYCTTTSDCTDDDAVHNFSTTGAIVNITNLASGCSNATTGYGDYTTTHIMTVGIGSTFNIAVQTQGTYSDGFAIWIDWNQNQVFDAGELVWNSGSAGTQLFTGAITVPVTALSGTTRMRVMASYNCVPTNPCTNCSTYGETEDYGVVVTGTAPTCLPPTGITASNIASNSVDLNWTENGSATLWQVHGTLAGLPVGSGVSGTTSVKPVNITGLSPSTSYDFYVRSICGPGDTSFWAGPFNVTTSILCPANAVCATYYAGDLPTDYQSPWVGPSTCPGVLSVNIPAGNWITGVDVSYSMTANNSAYMSEQRSRIFSPTINAGEAAYTAGVGSSAGTYVYNRTGLTFANQGTGTVVFNMDAGRTWGGTGCNTDYNKVANGTWTIIVYYGLKPACPPPTALTAASAGPGTVNLDWTENGTATQWQIEYGNAGFVQGAGTRLVTSTKPHTLSGLTAGIIYEYYVRAICSPGDTSNWAGPFSFAPALIGTYTIGVGTGYDFQSFNDAVNYAAIAGVIGSVTFQVASGTYTEQVTIPQIPGASATNTITFQSAALDPDLAILQFTGTSAANFTLQLNGADYIRLKLLTIKNLDITYGRVIDLISGAMYNIFEGNKIYSAGASSSTTGCIYDGSTLNHYNTYLNNYMSGGYYALYIYGVSTTSWEKGTRVIGNEIVGSYYYPIYMYYCDSVEVIGNYVHSGASAYSYGISVYYVNNYYRIVGNTVNIVGTTSSGCYGIRDYYGNYVTYNPNPTGYGLVANNMISVQGGTGTNYGLYSYYGNGTETYNNTVLMSGNTVTATRALHQYNTATNTLGQTYKNNVWVNTGGGYAAYFSTVAQVSACDYNDYYTSGGSLAYWGAARANLAALQGASSKDLNSISALPTFESNTDLHTFSLSIYQLGTPVALVLDDIDGDPRHSTTPCMGADEYILMSNDAGVIALVEPLYVCQGLHSIKVKVQNFGIIPLNSVTVNWSINGVAQSPFPNSTAIPVGGTADLTIGSYTFLNGVTYDLKFWPSNPNGVADQNTTNDTLIIVGFKTSMTGTYTIGAGTGFDYNTFGDAVNALSTLGVCGPVVFNVAAGTYNEQVTIPPIPGAGAVNTVTFQSATGDSASVILTGSGTYILQLNGADYIIIKQITVQTTVTSSTKVIEITGGADYNTITNCVIETPPTNTSSAYGICNNSGLDNNNVITNNNIKNGYYAIYWYGGSSTNLETGNRIEGNKLEGFYYYGIYSYGQNAMVIKGNTLINSASSGSAYGIYLYYNDNDHQTIGNTILITGTSTLYGINIYYCDGTTSLPGLTANNMIVVNGSSTRYAIRIYYSSYQDVYHNSTLAEGTTSTGYGLYLYNSSTTYTGHNIINNTFSNNSPSGYAAYYYNSTNLISTDYNNFYSTGSNFVYSGAARADLAALQTASGKDLNSMSVNPFFFSNTDLHTKTLPLFQAGTPLAMITVDIDNETRNPVAPCIGADEFILFPRDASITELTSLPCPGSSTVKVKIKNMGTQPFTGATVHWSVNGVAQIPFPYLNTLNPGVEEEITLGSFIFQGGVSYDILAYSTNPGGQPDQDPTNDTLKVFGVLTGLVGTYTIGAGVLDDFPSVADAADALYARGVCGPVVFNIAAGTYTGQVNLNEIAGVSAINTVTFQGATTSNQDVVIEYTASGTANNWTVRFNGTDYTTFKNLTIKALNATYGRVVEMINGADHNTIENNQLISAGTTSTTTGCIYDYNTLNHYNTYRNNYMSGGYYTVYVYGSSTTVWETGTIIEGNDIVGSYYYPIYAYYQDGIQILNNRIYDGVSPYSYGIYNYYPNNAYRVTGNEVYITSTTSTASYGIRDYYGNYYSYNASPTGYGIVANNMVGITGGTAANYGIYAYYSNGTEYYHNSFLMEGGSTSSYCLYQGNTTSNTLGQTFINNTMTNRVGGYAAYFGTTASVTTSNYNNFYSTSSNLVYWGAVMPTLASLQAASGKDLNSVNLNAPHTSVQNLRLNGLQLSGKGTYLTQVPTDIDGKPRGTFPTIGAHEVSIIPFDAGVTTIMSPTTAMTINEGDVVPVNVGVENFGTSPITNLSIAYTVNNGIPVVTGFTPNILPGTNASFVLPPFTSPVGQTEIAFYTILAGDTNNFNDTAYFDYNAAAQYDAEMVEIMPVDEGCGLGLDTIQVLIANHGLMPINGNITASYKLAGGITTVTQAVTTPIPVGDTILFVFNTLADFSVTGADSTFTIIAWVDLLNDNVPVNDTATLDAVSLHIPAPPALSAAHVPYGTPATLVATTTYDVNWYDSSTSPTILATSPTYVTPPLFDSATYWASAVSGPPPGTVGINVAPLATANASNCSTGPCSSFNNLNYGTCGTQEVWISTSGGPTPHNDFIDFEWTVPYTIDKMKIHHGGINTRFLSGGDLYTWQNNAWVYLSSFSGLPIAICENEVTFPIVTTTKFRITSFVISGSQASNPNFREIEIFTAALPGCEGIRVPVTANIIPTANVVTAPTTICPGTPVTLEVALTGTSPWSIEVSDGNVTTTVAGITTPTFTMPVTPLVTTTYSVLSIADYTNTFFPDYSQVTITVYPLLTANAGSDADICIGSTTPLDANGVVGSGVYTSYAWSPATGLSATNIKNPVADPLVTTTYTVTITDDNGCSATDEVVVNVHLYPVVSFTGLNSAYCIDAPDAMLTGTPAGGTFTGTGILGNTFSPALAGVGGPYTITYTYTDVYNCTSVENQTVTINPLPVVSINNLDAAYCVDATQVVLAGTPAGGTFSGPGVTAGVFSPAAAGAGGPYTITYEYTDGNGCYNSITGATVVNPLPVLSINNLAIGYCVDDASVVLIATPAGGTFSGPGVVAGVFYPATAGVGGPYTITYEYTDGNGCYNTTTATTEVYALPVLTITNVAAGYCVDAPAFALAGTPAGGTFKVNGVASVNFDPAFVGVGNHTILYSYTDGNGCFNTTGTSTDVHALPVVTFSTFTDICVDAAPVALTGGNPGPGVYTGTGVAAGTFSPATAGVGTHTITYTYTDGNNCVNFDTHDITVNPLPVLTFPPLAPVCISVAPFALNTATPAGGNYTGPGVAMNTFDPSVAGAGVHTITYTYTDGNNCTNSITQTIEVYALPVLTMGANPTICAGFSTPISVTSAGAGGFTYSWDNPGLLNDATIANPIATPAFTTTFTVTVTDINTCVKTGSLVVNVNQLPVINLGPDVDLCHGYTHQLNAVVTPAGAHIYNWNNGATLSSTTIANPVANPTVTTTYTLTVTDPNTCVNTASIVINVLPNPLPAITGLDANYCYDALSVTLTGAPAGGTFTINGIAATVFNPAIIGVGTHNVVYTFTNPNNCIASTSQVVNVRELPVANAGVDQNTCAGLPVFLSATVMGGTFPYTYAWTPAATLNNPNIHNPIATTLVDETYTVTVTDFYGCQGTDQMIVFATAIPVANVSSNVAICIGQSTQLQASGGDVFVWSPSYGLNNPNSATPIASPVATTTYTVTVSSICGVASNSVVVTVNQLPAVIFIGLPTDVCIDAPQFVLTGGPNGGVFSGTGVTGNIFNPSVAGAGTHNVTYTYTDGNGCTNSNVQPIVVKPLPVVNITGLSAGYCLTALPVAITTTPAGGTLTGPGIVGNTFDPSVAGVGTHSITYTYTDGFNCTNSITKVVIVDHPVSFTGLAPMYCNYDPVVTLTGIPAGGTFSGQGVIGNTFNPGSVPLGNRTVIYTMPLPYYCANSYSQVTMVNATPSAAFSGLNLVNGHCVSLTSVPLTGHPVGGIFSGQGITGNIFSPAAAGVGNHTITYTYTDVNSCSKSISQVVTVKPLPVVSFTGLAGPYCLNHAPVTLTGTPAGGTFSGPGITGTTFNPMTAGAGTHVITYTYYDNLNCVNSISQNVVVNPLPVVTFAPISPICANASSFAITGVSPAGGSFTGTGVLGNTFYPSIAGVGTHVLTYTYMNPVTGCIAAVTSSVAINPNPVANAGNDTTILVTTKASLKGSVTSGPGSFGWSWQPAAMVLTPTAANTQTINLNASQIFTFTVTDLFTGCTGTDQVVVNITGSPLNVLATATPGSICPGTSVTLSAIPTGGSGNYTAYSWSSVPAGSYLPNASITVSPTVTTTYKVKVSDGYNLDSAMVTVVVNPVPAAVLNPIAATHCLGGPTVNLSGTPSGGVFSGPGVSGSTFNPTFAGAGIHNITYAVTNSFGCTDQASQTIQVYTLPSVAINSTPPALCLNSTPLTLVGIPAGGTFTGPGITGNTFNPAVAGTGIKTITYTYTNANGCTNTATRNITVNALPIVSILNLSSSYCLNSPTVTLITNQQGGVFTGPGVGANTFSPSVAGTGLHNITYTYTDGNGCTNSTMQAVTVNALPVLSFTGLQSQYCVNAPIVTLVASPSGGTFSGTGVTGNQLNPAVAGVGTTTITYNYTNTATGCSNSISQNVNIRPLPIIGISVPNLNPCINAAPMTLAGSPAGGTFSGPGITGSSFNPGTAGAGAKVITYTASNSYGCSNSGTTTITVQALPSVTVGGLAPSYCLPTTQTAALVGFPAGGSFSGPGVTGNVFNPSSAGLGAKTITYIYTNQYGCSNSATTNTTVNTTVASFTGLASSYCLNSPAVTLTGSTAGGASGTFTGAGITGNSFNPATAGVGGHLITYTITNPLTGCTGVATQTTAVHTLPNVGILNLPANFCINSAPFTVITSPATGGTLSGPGITGNQFNAATAGLGTHAISYSFTSSHGCTVVANQSVTVHALPTVSFTGLAASYCQSNPVVTLTGTPAGGKFSGPGIQSVNQFNPFTAQPGVHTITYTYTNVYGCSNSTTQNVEVFADPVVSLGTDTTICINHIITLDAGAGFTTYQWSTGATTQTINVDGSTLKPGWHHFSVTVTNANNCKGSDQIRVIVIPCTGVDEPGSLSVVEVYPNPSTGMFNLIITNSEDHYDMTVFNDLGQIIHKEALETGKSMKFRKELNLTSHPTGMYFIRITGANTTKVVKVIVN